MSVGETPAPRAASRADSTLNRISDGPGRACAGWEDEGSPDPTCFPTGCERLDREGSCPGTSGRRTSWDDLTPEQQYRRNMLAIAALMGLFVVALMAVYGLALLTLWVVG